MKTVKVTIKLEVEVSETDHDSIREAVIEALENQIAYEELEYVTNLPDQDEEDGEDY